MNGLMFYLRERVAVTKGHVSYVDSGWAITRSARSSSGSAA